MTAFKEYIHAIAHQFFHFKFLEFMLLIVLGFMYIFRKIKHEWVLRTKCGKCGGPTRVYFMRSPFTINGSGDSNELFDWIICRNEDCAIAETI